MIRLLRRRYEGVELGGTYPELPGIGNAGRALMRFVLGRPMDNVVRTNATFWRDATSGYPSRWLRMAGWKRAAVRLLLAYMLPLLMLTALLLQVGARGAVSTLLTLHAAVLTAVLAPVLTYRRLRDHGLRVPVLMLTEDAEHGAHRSVVLREVLTGRKTWEREKVLPVARTLAPLLQRSYHPSEAREWVSVPRDYREQGGGAVEVLLPAGFSTTQEAARRRLAMAAAERLGMRDPSYTFELAGNAPRMLLRAPVLPPAMVSMTDVLPHLERSEEYTFLLGMAGQEALSIGLKEDSPHLALSAGSGAGKSELIKVLVMQALHWGWFVIILDWKEESQDWAEGLPGVRIIRSIEALHDWCVQIGEEVEFRKANRDAPRVKTLVVSEEWGITAPLLAEYWNALRSTADPEERRSMPVKSPAAQAMMKLNFTGRSLGLHQLLVAQRFSARVTNGNADLRESFTTILMSRWKSQTWKMLAPDIKPAPKKLTTPGRWVAVTGDEAVIFQAPLVTDDEAREWSLAGEANPSSPWSLRGGTLSSQQGCAETLQAATLGFSSGLDLTRPDSDHPELDYRPAPVILKKLSDISTTLEYAGVNQNILEMWRKRDENFPQPHGGTPHGGWLYDLAEMTRYVTQKRAAEAAEKAVK